MFCDVRVGVTVYAFSIENFKRPQEVFCLMELAKETFGELLNHRCVRDPRGILWHPLHSVCGL